MIDYTKPWDCIVAILDASGSMDSIKNDAIGGFNSFLNEQKEQKGQASFSVVKFNGEVSFPRDLLQDINDSEGLNNSNYSCIGMTALYDAVGLTIDKLGEGLRRLPEHHRPKKVIVVIQTDGENNASKFVTLEDVKQKIKHQEGVYSWKFLFLTSSFSANDQINTLKPTQGISYDNNGWGYRQAFNIASAATTQYRNSPD